MAGKSRSLGSLLVNVGADTRALETGLKSATASVNEFGSRTAQTTRKARAGFNNMSTAALGVGASMAAATGLGGLMALGPLAAGGVAMRGMNALTSPFEGSLRNQMRELRLSQREMRLQFSGGPAGQLFSDINYFTNPSNLMREAKVGFFEFFGGTSSTNFGNVMGALMHPTQGVSAQAAAVDSPGWSKGLEMSAELISRIVGFQVTP